MCENCTSSTPSTEKSTLLFPSNSALEFDVMWNPSFLKILLQAQPPYKKQSGGGGGGGTHYDTLVSWDITLHTFVSWNFIHFQQKQPIKVKIWSNFTWAVESLKLCTVVTLFCKNQKNFQLKKYRRHVSHGIEGWCKV